MNSLIKLLKLGLLLMIVFPAIAQDSTDVAKKSHYNRKGMITVGFYGINPNAESYVNQGYSLGEGYDVSVSGYVAPHVILGTRITVFRGSVTDKQLVGNYDLTQFNLFGTQIGYHFFEEKRIQLIVQGGFGWVNYRNSKPGAKDFKDSGSSYYFNPQLSILIFKWLAVYGAVDFRFDKLKIKAPPEIKNNFDHVNYVNISTGIRLKL